MQPQDEALSQTPEMSVVIVTPDRYATIRMTVRHLRAQTVRQKLELVIVAPATNDLGLETSDLKDFLNVRVVEVGPINSTARARMAGIQQATASIVALIEDHSYPAPGWAEALMNAHRQAWAAVGPVLVNGNPRSAVSWANLLIEYCQWLDPTPAGVMDHLPGHNSAYKRGLLLDYGPDLEAMLEAESLMHWDLRARGYRLYLEPAAKTSHLNFSSPFSTISLRFHGGRLFASARSRSWSYLRRLMYTGAAPLIPLVRFRRIIGQLHSPGRRRDLPPGVLPAVLLGLVVDGMGEMVGYAAGGGRSMEKLSHLEFHRYRHMSERDARATVDP